MHSNNTATSADIERENLRKLIEERTKDFVSKNGKIETIEIIKRRENQTSIWETAAERPEREHIQSRYEQISAAVSSHYATAPCIDGLAAELGISRSSLQRRASDLGVTRQGKSSNTPVPTKVIDKAPALTANPAQVVAAKSSQPPPAADKPKTTPPQNATAYISQQLKQINRAADEVERSIEKLEAICNS